LIAASDRYIGYDSAGQHIAAAIRVPTLTIFVNSNSATFAERWRPYGPGIIEVFNVG
jgi:ADP-heptose:LPS heptosyltransferase